MQGLARWKGKTALVTGASAGIGEAIAHALAGMGMIVALAGRRVDELERVASSIRAARGQACPFAVDIGSESEIQHLFARVEAEMGPVDVLVNNAGVGFQSAISQASVADWRRTLDVNVLGTSICIREALRHMANRPGTAIITILSMAAHRVPAAAFTYYSASKHALKAIMEGLRIELVNLASPTKVGSISPGTVATEFHKLFARSDEDPTDALGFERLVPQDIADAVVYMLSTPPHVQVNDIQIRPLGQLG